MKLTATLINVLAGLLVVGGILMWIFIIPNQQISLIISLFGILFYVLADPEQPRMSRRNLQRK